MIAVCGLVCPLSKAHTDIEAARNLAGWFKSEGWIKENEGAEDVMKKGPYCRGVQGRPVRSLGGQLLDSGMLCRR